MTNMEFDFMLYSNSLSSSLPTQLGRYVNMQSSICLDFNKVILHPHTYPLVCSPPPLAMIRPALSHNIGSHHLPHPPQHRIPPSHSIYVKLSGPIPTEIGNYILMYHELAVANNQLSSTIPTELGRLREMRSNLEWHNNALTSIPSELGQLENMAYGPPGLFTNPLASTIPTEMGQVNKIASFALSEASLTSTIPSELGQLSHLVHNLDLSGNALSGPIPTELGRLDKIHSVIALYDNSVNKTHHRTPLPTPTHYL